MPHLRDLTGKQFGKLTIVSRAPNKGRRVTWNCKCSCGNIAIVRQDDLISAKTRSCGCLHKKWIADNFYKHGAAIRGNAKREYKIWLSMKNRCQNPKHIHYHRYGGRGISVCFTWQYSFESFLRDMGEAPSLNHTLNRIDNDGSYTPENCCWATRKEQSNNRCDTKFYTYKGKTKSRVQWSEELNIHPDTLRNRIDRSGWTIEKAFTTPVK